MASRRLEEVDESIPQKNGHNVNSSSSVAGFRMYTAKVEV